MSRRTILVLILLAAAPALFATQDRSAVSRNGLDTNPCSVASPCRSFTSAMAATNGAWISGRYGSRAKRGGNAGAAVFRRGDPWR